MQGKTFGYERSRFYCLHKRFFYAQELSKSVAENDAKNHGAGAGKL